MRFVDEHKDVFGVEPICRVLPAHGAPIAPSTCSAGNRPLSARAVRDGLLSAASPGCGNNYEVYDADKAWLELNRREIAAARCTVEWLMRGLGLARNPP